MYWFRIDNRLIHGQVIEGWLPYLNADELVVFNDELADNDIQQQILLLAVPGRVHVYFESLAGALKIYKRIKQSGRKTLFLVAKCADAAKLVQSGIPIPVLNVGNMHYGPGKWQICAHVAVSDADARCLQNFKDNGTELDFRCVPGDMPQMAEEGWLDND